MSDDAIVSMKPDPKTHIRLELASRLRGELSANNTSILVLMIEEGVEAYLDSLTIKPLKAIVEEWVSREKEEKGETDVKF